MHLVLIETSGNQNYIFATNKLRENVGASELTYRVGTQWVLEAVAAADGPKDLWADATAQLRQNLCDSEKNLPLSDTNSVEVVVATSGKALLLVSKPEIGRQIIQQVTMKALEHAPGIDVCGVISRSFNLNTAPLDEVIREVHEEFEEVRANRPGPAMRFLRLPVVAECVTSGYPASTWDNQSPGINKAKSAVSLAKLRAAPKTGFRLDNLLTNIHPELSFASKLEELEEQCDWFAIVHADGNGLGEIFLNFGEHIGLKPPKNGEACKDYNDCFVAKLRRFSVALDLCTEKAVQFAVTQLLTRFNNYFPIPLIVPIVLGGDDLTVICDGKIALQFTRDFLFAFEQETGKAHRTFTEDAKKDCSELDSIVADIANEALGAPRLSACAGVAIVKPHYPFSAAYDLAEELIKSAKQIKKIVLSPKKDRNNQPVPWPCSALDFHALYDSTASELAEIRGKLVKDEGQTRLYARPYVVSEQGNLNGAIAGQDWVTQHRWSDLHERVEAILAPDTEDEQHRAIPNSQLHELRAGLFLGKAGANARYDLISHRYEANKLKVFEEVDNDLFFKETANESATKFLDAMEAANFWVQEEKQQSAEEK